MPEKKRPLPADGRGRGFLLNRRERRKRSPDSESGFVAFICFCVNSVARAAREDSQSMRSARESVVHFLWLRQAAPGDHDDLGVDSKAMGHWRTVANAVRKQARPE